MKIFFAFVDLNDLELHVATDDQTFLDHLRESDRYHLAAAIKLDDEDAEKMQLRKAAGEQGFYPIPWHKYAEQFFKEALSGEEDEDCNQKH